MSDNSEEDIGTKDMINEVIKQSVEEMIDEVVNKARKTSVESESRVYSKDSFDRFGDDLSEVIFSYLTFKDKVRFECVAKHWRRLVLNNVLYFDYKLCKQTFRESPTRFRPGSISQMTNDQIVSVIKKCHNMKTMTLWVNTTTVSSILLFANSCSRLQSIVLVVTEDISPETITEFGQKFGSIVDEICIEIHETSIIRPLLSWCSNLKRFNCQFWRDWSCLVGNQLLPKLECLGNIQINSNKIPAFVQLVDKCKKTLKNIEMYLGYYNNTNTSIEELFQQLYRLKNLECLHLYLVNNEIDLTTRMTALSQSCPNLSKITLDQTKIALSPPSIPLIGIKSLDIGCDLMSSTAYHSDTHPRDYLFAILSELTHNLKELRFKSNFFFKNKHLIDISRMKDLKRLCLMSVFQEDNKLLNDSGVIQLLDNCKQMRDLKLEVLSDITSETIDKLKEMANNRPKDMIRFHALVLHKQLDRFPNSLELIPPNLSINLINYKFAFE